MSEEPVPTSPRWWNKLSLFTLLPFCYHFSGLWRPIGDSQPFQLCLSPGKAKQYLLTGQEMTCIQEKGAELIISTCSPRSSHVQGHVPTLTHSLSLVPRCLVPCKGAGDIHGYGRALVSMQIKTEMTTCKVFSSVCSFSSLLFQSQGLSVKRQHIRKTRVWGPVGSVCLGNTDGIILKQLVYLGMTEKPAGDCFVLWQGQQSFVYEKAFGKSFLSWIHQNFFNGTFLTEDTVWLGFFFFVFGFFKGDGLKMVKNANKKSKLCESKRHTFN